MRVHLDEVTSVGDVERLRVLLQTPGTDIFFPNLRDPPSIVQAQLRSFENGVSAGTSHTFLLTSGSSGQRKIVVHSVENHLASARAVTKHFSLDRKDTWLIALPLYHVGGLAILFRTLVSGMSYRLKAHAQSLEEALLESRINIVSFVPTQLYRLLQNSAMRTRLSHMKAVVVGGAAVHPSLVEAWSPQTGKRRSVIKRDLQKN